MQRFLDFVEIQTKLATILPFLAALAYVFYTIGTINLSSTLIYIIAALLLDMSITAINNHFNRREEGKKPHYGYWGGLGVIGVMLLVFACLGLYLAYIHGITILLAGAFCLFIGIIYTLGPAPISKTTYGELVSGFVVGTVIMFIVVSINNPYFQPLGLYFDSNGLRLAMDIDLLGLFSFGLVTLPATFSISNILLANNICDEEEDRLLRYTLVHHIGRDNALWLFAALYVGVYLAIVLASILGLVPLWSLLTLLTVVPVQRNIRAFFEKQVKAETFALSIKNFVIISLSFTLCMIIGGLL